MFFRVYLRLAYGFSGVGFVKGLCQIWIDMVVIIRAGLRVVPEWSYERQWEAHFSAQAQCFMTLVHL